MHLVARNTDEVNTEPFRLERNFAEALHRVRVKQRRGLFSLDRACNVFQRQQNACFVIHRHHADQNRLRINGRVKFLFRNISVRLRLHIHDLKALFFKLCHRIEHRRMLDRRRHNLVARALFRVRRTQNRNVVALCAAGREINLPWLRRKSLGNDLPRRSHLLFRRKALAVQRRGVAVAFRHHVKRLFRRLF